MWFITLLVLALAAFFIIKAVKAHSARQSAEQERLQEGSGLAGSLSQEHHSNSNSANTADSASSATGSAANTADSASGATGSATAVVAGVATAAAATVATRAATSSTAVSSDRNTGSDLGLNTGDNLRDVREMIKILNLAEPDAGRLAISREQFSALRSGDSAQAPSSDALAEVADKLRRMLA